MKTSTQAPPRPSRYDGLTKDARQSLYSPEAYTVTRTGAIEFRVVNENGAEMVAWNPYGLPATFNIKSNTGNCHMVRFGICDCPDVERGIRAGRRCKHSAAAEAVETYLDREEKGDPFAGEPESTDPARDQANHRELVRRAKQIQGPRPR